MISSMNEKCKHTHVYRDRQECYSLGEEPRQLYYCIECGDYGLELDELAKPAYLIESVLSSKEIKPLPDHPDIVPDKVVTTTRNDATSDGSHTYTIRGSLRYPYLTENTIPTKIDEVRFWRYVEIGVEYQCWAWKAHRDASGHGLFYLHGYTRLAYYTAYIIAYGEIPCGRSVIQTCRNAPCVNPAHLVLDASTSQTTK